MTIRQIDFPDGYTTNTVPTVVPVGLTVLGTRLVPVDINASGGIAAPLTEYRHVVYIQGDGGAVDITANPQIGAGLVDGQELELVGCSNVNTVKFENGTGLILNGPATMIADSRLYLTWDGTNWSEKGRNGIEQA